jgi:hypothetical protein
VPDRYLAPLHDPARPDPLSAPLTNTAHPPRRARVADNLLYHGDNLHILRRYVDDESVDLVYLDPPFK